MAKTREQKEEEIKSLEDKIAKAKSIVFTSYTGVNVAGMQELRKNYREQGVAYQAAKKRYIDLALDNAKVDHEKVKDLDGSIAVAFGMEDEVAPARIAKDFNKTHESFAIKAGLLKIGEVWKYLSATEVLEFANLPTRDELLARLVGSINAPVSGFVNVLAGNIRGLVNVLKGIKDTK